VRGLWLTLLIGCGTPPMATDSGAAGVDAGVPDGARCLDDARFETCADGACAITTCRGDALCADAACVPWTEAELTCGFTLRPHPDIDGRILVEVDPGGFPRAQVEALRFDFGDGTAGWAESLGHDYAEGGRYLVTLDVRLTGFRTCRARRVAVVAPDPGPVASVTVDAIGDQLNGSVPLADGRVFVLQVPRRRFTVDVALLETEDDPFVSVALEVGALGDRAERVRYEDDGARVGAWLVDEELPLGPTEITLTATTASGVERRDSLTVEVVELPPERDPTDRPTVWLFRPSVDHFTTARAGDGLVSEQIANRAPDLAEELALIGMQGPDADANAIYLGWLLEALRRETYRFYGIAPDGTPRDDIALTIVFEGEPDAPDPATFDPAGDFSMMRFGGTFDGFVGFSGISPWNHERTDDSLPRRGVATASLISILTTTPIVAGVLAPLSPEGGAPVGTHPLDDAALDPGFDRFALDADPDVLARHETLRTIARYLALVFASVTAHEMGHAMGLMPNGLPPDGFFGDVDDVPFVNPERTNPWHADLPGLNLMQAGGDYLGVIDEAIATIELPRGTSDLVRLAELLGLENRLSPLARAYMQGRLTYASDASMAAGLAVGCRSY